jgi:Big-like domain-containing protein
MLTSKCLLTKILRTTPYQSTANHRKNTVRLTVQTLEDRIVPSVPSFSVNNDSYSMIHDRNLDATSDGSSNVLGVLHNDSSPNGILIVTEVNGETQDVGQEITLPSGATLTLNSDGSFLYIPILNWTGSDSFTYTASDGVNSDAATVDINVTNHAPVVVEDDSFSVGYFLSNIPYATDEDGDDLDMIVVTAPSHGDLWQAVSGIFS